ncbi:hypothetical protein AVEN_37826-1 [Araneus ventricosus]|uniref:Secreted protein n=1 Tax=Araneus ventricosus TaxID=182803 RepID=A0A4Y2ULB5_ARAVE|nr:hypothetical protein AVEN_37826-1 [Araneus ventricosus]
MWFNGFILFAFIIVRHMGHQSIILLQVVALPHVGLCVHEVVIRQQFAEERIINRAFIGRWSLRLTDLKPCDFCCGVILKSVVFKGNLDDIATLKCRINPQVQ